MLTIDIIINQFYQTDKEIVENTNKFNDKEVDISQPNCNEELKHSNDKLLKQLSPLMIDIITKLIENFKFYTIDGRKRIWYALSQTKFIQNRISVKYLV